MLILLLVYQLTDSRRTEAVNNVRLLLAVENRIAKIVGLAGARASDDAFLFAKGSRQGHFFGFALRSR